MVLAAPPHELRKKGIPMAQIIGKEISIVPRVPYVPIEPWDWFKEMGIEDKMGGPPPMGAGVTVTAKAASGQGTYTLSSGGTLVVE